MTDPARNFILFSSADWKTRYWTNKQHNAAMLADLGHKVLYVETVGLRRAHLTDGRDLRRLFIRLTSGLQSLLFGAKQVRPNVWVLSPLGLPWGRRYAVTRRLNAFLLNSMLRRFSKGQRFSRPEIWTYHPFVLDIVEELSPSALVYQSVDDLVALPGVDREPFQKAERDLLARSDVVFVTSRVLEARYSGISDRVHFVTNVVDMDHFARAFAALEPEDLRNIPHPRLGYHGVLSDQKLDIPLLETLSKQNPAWHFVLIGDEREGQDPHSLAPLRRLANVHFLGGREYAELPAYLAGFDVGLIPLAGNDYTRSVFPMKLYEFLAAGVPVASTDMPYLKDVDAPIVVGSDSAAFAAAVVAQLARGRLDAVEAERAVGNHTYAARLGAMLTITGGDRS